MTTTTDISPDAGLTPAMRQHRAAKDAYPDALIFFRMGDFYELFYEDAVVAARELQLTLTARDKARSVPMCGVPYHAAAGYVQRLLRKGFRVAMCDQMEDPKLAKGVVKREVTRVLTPGTALDSTLEASQSQWLAALAAVGSGANACVGVASIDLSTGEFRATEFAGGDAWALALDELGRMRPAEVLHAQGASFGSGAKPVRQGELGSDAAARTPKPAEVSEIGATDTPLEDWVFTDEYALPLLRQQLKVYSLDGMGLTGHAAAGTAAGAIVHYLRATKQGALEHLDTLRFYARNDALELDAVTVRHLELVDPLLASDGPQTTLFWTMDACCTPMGKRLLRAQLVRPMQDRTAIDGRLEAVGEAAADIRRREALRRSMEGVLDLERLLGRVALDSAGPREVVALGNTLAKLPGVRSATSLLVSARWTELAQGLDPLDDLSGRIGMTLVEEPPVTLNDGGAIRGGVDGELDELRELSTSGRQRLAAIEERERTRTGINSLKVRFNSVFGYYIEITKANSKAVPSDYERKQTLVNAERFTTPELKELEQKILTAQERSVEIERRLFAELRASVLASAGRIRESARRLAEIDLLGCFAHMAALRGWVRPVLEDSPVLEVIHGRHPVVERHLEESGAGRFVPNSLYLCAHELTPTRDGRAVTDGAPESSSHPSLALITGPNMGGKSTYLRQAALLVILAQCGSFVPAERMRLGLVDRVYTRIGASDNVARGRSTFMVEMTETAAILNTATERSLVLLDEMGRGTATYDGLSLAWATVEQLHNIIGARTLFATHYHELTLLAERLARLENLRVVVKENAGGIVFLHTVERGAASKSYGIEVARLAGLPSSVIARAREVLKLHERAESQQVREAVVPAERTASMQMTMFTPLSQRIVDRLEEVDVDGLTPRDALSLLAELQRELKGGA
ncbi:DNA mismatch repair protein MutS [Bryocella elongata]|uniref:DNA mismatch repair protein MutS n=1 Tax=Bryocella elongata TaxID=863522 RepID=A0A1H5U8W4_9BACT|nr:DNA mismatch repair protein MutS [Bryocella elongata]SEF71463.1 DNA mismatch repair protein MutS [Bryocella elongata]